MRGANGKSVAVAGSGPKGQAVAVLKDRRAWQRVRLSVPVKVAEVGTSDSFSFETEDLCPGGAFLRSDLLFEPEQLLKISMQLPQAGLALESIARVAWVNREPEPDHTYRNPGMGMQFLDLPEAERAALQTWLYMV